MSHGRNLLGHIHVRDLADIYVRLLADAAAGTSSSSSSFPPSSDPRLWGPQAYYFACGEEVSFAAYMEALVAVLSAKGVVPTATTASIRRIGIRTGSGGGDAAERERERERALVEQTARLHGYGVNVRCQGERAQKLLGWRPREKGVRESLEEVVEALVEEEEGHE